MLWSITREPKDRLADVRISLGSVRKLGAYIVFRGEPEEVIELLEKTLQEAREAVLTGKYEDKRGRPQG